MILNRELPTEISPIKRQSTVTDMDYRPFRPHSNKLADRFAGETASDSSVALKT